MDPKHSVMMGLHWLGYRTTCIVNPDNNKAGINLAHRHDGPF